MSSRNAAGFIGIVVEPNNTVTRNYYNSPATYSVPVSINELKIYAQAGGGGGGTETSGGTGGLGGGANGPGGSGTSNTGGGGGGGRQGAAGGGGGQGIVMIRYKFQ